MKALFNIAVLIALMAAALGVAGTQLLTSSRDLNTCRTDLTRSERRWQETQVELDAANGQLRDLMLRYENDVRQREEEIRTLKDQLRTTREDTARLMQRLAQAQSQLNEARRQSQALAARPETRENATPFPAGDTPTNNDPLLQVNMPEGVNPYLLAVAGPAALTLFGLARRLINHRPAATTPWPTFETEDAISIRMSRHQLADYIQWRRRHDQD